LELRLWLTLHWLSAHLLLLLLLLFLQHLCPKPLLLSKLLAVRSSRHLGLHLLTLGLTRRHNTLLLLLLSLSSLSLKM
jgi:hypothetical protein